MIIGSGTFSGRNGYRLEGRFELTRNGSGAVRFNTSEDFFFGNATGGGTPAPGFAFFRGDPTGLPNDIVAAAAEQTDFLRIADDTVAVSGRQEGAVPAGIDVSRVDTVFLWCFKVPFVLGVGRIERGAHDGK